MAKITRSSTGFHIAAERTVAETKRKLVETAKREHEKIMRGTPRPGSFERYVDGAKGKPEDSVKPFGVIEYRYSHLDAVAQFALETLFDLSPVDSGDYRRSHALFLNKDAVRDLKGWKPGDEIHIASFLPYSRIIENGSMKMKVAGSDQVYAQASWVVHRRFGNLANIGWTWIGIIGSQTDRGGDFNKSGSRYPALWIGDR